ncbi:LysR family transcriptional regulator [Aquabacterium sp.]|uniref:LysR family transcriptional regulator n=1 Tax=Aquabacterium sp. TaxID=1872578 RepID=UPI002BD9B5DA|nr:LysR family transcriptional regulator [Aquabacterium sp.]HSW04376.1 LysR family transcriptional regulator [Aquabacterium sp.]
MRYQRLDLNLLTALRALLTEKNVTRAGEALHVSQSAMSGILARLRDYFDDPLIVPVGRRMELTPLAESLVKKVNDVLLMVDATLGTKPDFDPARSRRHFTIVASDYVTSVLLLDVLRAVHHEVPGLTIEFRQPSTLAYQELEAGEVDFVINPESYSVPTQSSCVLFEDSYHAVVDRDNTAIGDSISLAQYLQQRHVIFQANGRPFYDAWFERTHGDGRRIEVLANSFMLLPRLVVRTQRVATLHTRLAMQACETLPVRLVRLDFETPKFVETLQWHRYRDHDPASQWLRERILQFAQALPALPGA